MKTRTLLMLSVAMALAILLAGGVFLLQLSNETTTVESASIGDVAEVGDLTVTVLDATETAGTLIVEVDVAGVDDVDGVDSFSLVTGDRRLAPVSAPADGRCVELTVAAQRCTIEFDVSAVESSSRVLIVRRGDEQRNWTLDISG